MTFQFTPIMLIFAISAVLTAGITVYGIRQLQNEGRDTTTLTFTLLVGAATIWTLSRTLEWLFTSELLTQVWLTGVYVGFGGCTVSLFAFALAFTGKEEWLTRRNIALVSVLPVAAVFLAATNSYHSLLWTGEFTTEAGLYIIDRAYQPAFHAYYLYTQVLLLTGVYLLLRMALTSPDLYRNQSIAVLLGAITPLFIGVLFVFDVTPFVPTFVDLTPVGFAVTGLCFGYAIFRYQMLDLVPVARDTVIESMRDGYIVLDDDQRVVDLNDAAREVLEADNDVIGSGIETVLPASAGLVEDHEHGTQSEGEISLEIDGEQRFLVANVSSLYDGDRLIGRLLLIRDVTDRRAVQKRYQALIENSSDLIIVTDKKGTITYASPSLQTITGVDPETVLGEMAVAFIHEDDRKKVQSTFDDLIDNPGEKHRVEYRLHDEAGNVLYMESEIWNLLDNPFVEGIVTNAREITKRKKRERELEETNQELTETNEKLEQFAGVISHDLRNPINVAKGHADIARQTGNEESFEKIEDSLERMEAIIDDVLTLARQGDGIGETEPVSLADSAQTAWEHVATDEATLEIASDTTLEADGDRLLQLLENCFRNAVEHGSTSPDSRTHQDREGRSPSGSRAKPDDAVEHGSTSPRSQTPEDAVEHVGPDVTVRVGSLGDGFYIEDDGPGIPPERRDDIFEAGETTNTEGTGLGLSIVSEIADAHGWTVEIAEGSDGGARFEFVTVEATATH